MTFGGGSSSVNPDTLLPWQPCLACNKGDADRMLAIDGGRGWLAACLVAMAGFVETEAVEFVDTEWENSHPSPAGDGRRMMLLQVCRTCADEAHRVTGVPINLVKAGEVNVLGQPLEDE